ncbi:MAG: argininosuccinate synthase [Candidatus Latescibacteria bacterium]|jgi:argininosuccinate synthase|nr:argininosuccinate synthase [Candidatus Latescibacterota bacterium]MBT4138386.1 argininosuccinate synthase [Candidatus Latescibacterota bacterium]
MTINDLRGKSVALASSGGLDSCTVTKWMVDRGVDVVSLTGDIGQPDEVDMDDIRKRMLACGASEAALIDLKDDLAETAIAMLIAQARYEGGYWNTTGIARHVTTRGLLKEMNQRGIDVLVHGATGRGNDQVRFQLVANMLKPTVSVYAPWRDSAYLDQFGGRKEMIDFCNLHNLPITASYEKPYSTDANFLGLTHEAGQLESLEIAADYIEPGMGVFPAQAPDEPELFTVRLEKGRPVQINGEDVGAVEAILKANEIGGRNGVGIGIHAVENRFVGIKSRGVYESPGLCLLSECYELLLQQVLDRRARRFFDSISVDVAEQIYQGYYYDLASQMMRGALAPVANLLTGEITVAAYKGTVIFKASKNVPHSLYSEETASMEDVGDYDHRDSEGFLNVLGVSAKAEHAAGQIEKDLLEGI